MGNDFWTNVSFNTLKYFGNMVILALWSNFGGQNRKPIYPEQGVPHWLKLFSLCLRGRGPWAGAGET